MDIKKARKNVIEQQIRPWGGLNVRANQALSDIPRENFVPEEYLSLVFADIEIPLVGSAKMFSPKIEGRILDSLDIQGHENILYNDELNVATIESPSPTLLNSKLSPTRERHLYS